MLTFIDQNLAPGFSFSFLTLEKIKDSILNYIIFLKCDFSLSRAIQILESSKPGSVVVYCDASSKIRPENLHRLDDWINRVRRDPLFGFMVFKNGFPEVEYSKKDLLKAVNYPESRHKSGQICSGIFIVKNCEATVAFFNKWVTMSLMNNYHFVDDSPSLEPEYESFKCHRHDQSIFSCLIKMTNHQFIVFPDYFISSNEFIHPIAVKGWKKFQEDKSPIQVTTPPSVPV